MSCHSRGVFRPDFGPMNLHDLAEQARNWEPKPLRCAGCGRRVQLGSKEKCTDCGSGDVVSQNDQLSL